MFGEPGHLYVYLSYGMHHCANVVTEPDGVAGAVLLRGAAVEVGEEMVRRRRGQVPASRLLRGPGNLCRGLDIGRGDNGADLCDVGRFTIAPAATPLTIVVGPRVGITQAPDLPLRFAIVDEPAVSAPLPVDGRRQ